MVVQYIDWIQFHSEVRVYMECSTGQISVYMCPHLLGGLTHNVLGALQNQD